MKDFGDLIYFTHEPGELELAIERMVLKVLGHNIMDPVVQMAAKNIALEDAEATRKAHREAGVPKNIIRLFKAGNKTKACQLIRRMLLC